MRSLLRLARRAIEALLLTPLYVVFVMVPMFVVWFFASTWRHHVQPRLDAWDWCKMGFHAWTPVTFLVAPYLDGRRCSACKRVQMYWPEYIFFGWRDTDLTISRFEDDSATDPRGRRAA